MDQINLQSLKPSEVVRILNSTNRGTVLTEARFRRHRNRAGYSIGDNKTVNLFRYAAWLLEAWQHPKNEPIDYLEKKRLQTIRNAEEVRTAQDIGELPEVGDPVRKATAVISFKTFCETYFAEVFYLPWSPDHLHVIEKIERCVKQGGLFALAMPRASGKTVMCQAAVAWAALTGSVPFVCLIAASAERARVLLETIKTWLETNTLLMADFPEVCYPVQCLERITNRQKGQKYRNAPTRIEWNADKVVLPTIENSPASGVVITCSGMKGSDIRGQHHARPDGHVVRPKLVLIDDPQTSESAWSKSQCDRRESILAGDVLGMAGPGEKISGLMACTVICPGDMADRILNREDHPEWQGERTKLVYSFPVNERLWTKYAELRNDSLRNDGDGSNATRFYESNRTEMDAGSRVAWPERFNPDEISALQHAMNLRLRNESAFEAEYQNQPMQLAEGDDMLTAGEIAQKTNGYAKGTIPLGCHKLTMFIDVQQKALYWLVCAWEENFSGYVVEYGTWPEQNRPYFTLRDIQHTLSVAIPNAGLEGAIYGGLEKLCAEKLGGIYYREDGLEMKIHQTLIDANWGQSTDVIYQFCGQSIYRPLLFPSHGKFVGASSVPFSEYTKRRGDRIGHHWRIPNTIGKRAIQHVLIDTNYWKSFVHARLAVHIGDPGCLSLFGHDEKQHLMLADHLVAEYRIKTVANNRTIDEWKLRASHPDNHWLDCLVGCAVAASMQGIELATLKTIQKPKRERIKLSNLMKF